MQLFALKKNVHMVSFVEIAQQLYVMVLNWLNIVHSFAHVNNDMQKQER